MSKRVNLRIIFLGLFLFTASMSMARDYIVYSIVQELPMGEPDEVLKKNYYINMGTEQGVGRGTTLDVYRNISRVDPYKTKKRYTYKLKVGQLEVIHSEEGASIGSLKMINDGDQDSLLEIENVMIGDQVRVHTN